jgi:hypothetical protein
MQANGAKDGAAEKLSMHACVDGLSRAEAARVFYQLLGTLNLMVLLYIFKLFRCTCAPVSVYHTLAGPF